MSDGAAHGWVRVWLRLEGLLAFLLATYLDANAGGSWFLFGALFVAPDVSFAAYLAGPRAGAAGYNVMHSYVGHACRRGRLARREAGYHSRSRGERTWGSTVH